MLQLNEQRRRAYVNAAELQDVRRKLDDELTLHLCHLNKLAGRILEGVEGEEEEEQEEGKPTTVARVAAAVLAPGATFEAAYLDGGRSRSPALAATTEKVPDNEEDYICHSQRRDIQGGDENAGAGAGPSGVPTRGPDDAMIEIEDLRTFDMWTNFVRIVSA